MSCYLQTQNVYRTCNGVEEDRSQVVSNDISLADMYPDPSSQATMRVTNLIQILDMS